MDVRDLDPEERTVTKRFLDCITHIAKSEDNFTESHIREMRDQVLDRGAVHNRNTGLGPFKGERAEPVPFPTTHYAHLHSTKLVLDHFNSSAYNEVQAVGFFNRQNFVSIFIESHSPGSREFSLSDNKRDGPAGKGGLAHFAAIKIRELCLL